MSTTLSKAFALSLIHNTHIHTHTHKHTHTQVDLPLLLVVLVGRRQCLCAMESVEDTAGIAEVLLVMPLLAVNVSMCVCM